MSKFVQTIDEDGDPIIINLDGVTHVSRTGAGLVVFLQGQRAVSLKGGNADTLWEFMTAASWQIDQQPQEKDKK